MMAVPSPVPDDIRPGCIVLMGVPLDVHASFERGPAQAPPLIREKLFCDATNLFSESGLDLGERRMWRDIGDIRFDPDQNPLEALENTAAQVLDKQARLVGLGGDHAVTYALVRAYARFYPRLNILHLDAHPDLYDELNGDRFSHACPFARIMEQGCAQRLVQIGIRTLTAHQREQARRFGVEVHEMHHWNPDLLPQFDDPVYLSIDLDCLDPAFAPGVSHQEPGGLSTRQVIALIQDFGGELVGADIVEYNPRFDLNGATARVAAKLLKEILARMSA